MLRPDLKLFDVRLKGEQLWVSSAKLGDNLTRFAIFDAQGHPLLSGTSAG